MYFRFKRRYHTDVRYAVRLFRRRKRKRGNNRRYMWGIDVFQVQVILLAEYRHKGICLIIMLNIALSWILHFRSYIAEVCTGREARRPGPFGPGRAVKFSSKKRAGPKVCQAGPGRACFLQA